jgi:hypothetical protein
VTAAEFIKIVVDLYRDKPDDEVISLGHWHPMTHEPPMFSAQIRITLGELRAMVQQ